jgi:hypothetical protein
VGASATRSPSRSPSRSACFGQQEEGAEAAGELLAGLVAGAVEVGGLAAALVEGDDPAPGRLDELVVGAELDRVGGARLGARGLEPVLEAVVAERALGGAAVVGVAVRNAERARRMQ